MLLVIKTHRAHVCVDCDCLIIGLEEVKFVKKETLLQNLLELCVSGYEEYSDGVPLYPELGKQTKVDDDDLKHMLLLPKTHLDHEGYECC